MKFGIFIAGHSFLTAIDSEGLEVYEPWCVGTVTVNGKEREIGEQSSNSGWVHLTFAQIWGLTGFPKLPGLPGNNSRMIIQSKASLSKGELYQFTLP